MRRQARGEGSVLTVKVVKIKKVSSGAFPVESVEGVCHVELHPPKNGQRGTRWKWHDLGAPRKGRKGGCLWGGGFLIQLTSRR